MTIPAPAPAPTPQPAPTPAPAPAPAPTPEPTAHWSAAEHYDADTRGWMQNRGYDKMDVNAGLQAAIKGHRELEKFHGVPADRLLRLPEENGDMAPVYDRLGRPAEAKLYDLTLDGQTGDEAETAFIQAQLHAAGLSKKQGETLFKSITKHNLEAMAAQEKAANEVAAAEITALKSEWKENYDANMALADRGADEIAKRSGLDEATVGKLKAAIGGPGLAKLFHAIGVGLLEPAFVRTEAGNGSSGFVPKTKEAAAQRKEELLADKDWTAKWLNGDAQAKLLMTSLNTVLSTE